MSALYFVALVPGEPIYTEVHAFKEIAALQFNSKRALLVASSLPGARLWPNPPAYRPTAKSGQLTLGLAQGEPKT